MLNKDISLQRIAAQLSAWHSRLKQMPPVRMLSHLLVQSCQLLYYLYLNLLDYEEIDFPYRFCRGRRCC